MINFPKEKLEYYINDEDFTDDERQLIIKNRSRGESLLKEITPKKVNRFRAQIIINRCLFTLRGVSKVILTNDHIELMTAGKNPIQKIYPDRGYHIKSKVSIYWFGDLIKNDTKNTMYIEIE